MKLGVLIPTRERAAYLPAAIRSALAAADRAECEVEVLVSDNASTDATADVVAAFDHPSLRYLRHDARLSMRENFERAVAASTATHLTIIGDDDGVLPHGLAFLARLLRDSGAEAVGWRVMNYHWPDPERARPGWLRVHPAHLSGRIRRIDPAARLEDFRRAAIRSYHNGAMIYHGCVARSLIDRAMAEGGAPYFRCSSPDVFTAIRNLIAMRGAFLRVDLPITLGGASPRSNGAGGQRAAASGATSAEFERFIAESKADPHQGRLPAACKSLALMTLDALQTAQTAHGLPPAFDAEAWARRVGREIAQMHPTFHEEHRAYARLLLGREADVPAGSRADSADAASEGPPSPRPGLSRSVLAGGAAMADMAAASAALDALVALAGRSTRPSRLSWATSVLSIARKAAGAARPGRSSGSREAP